MEDVQKQRVKNIIQLFFFSVYAHTDQGSSPTISDITFPLPLSSLAFFFFLVPMKDSCSHLAKMWA